MNSLPAAAHAFALLESVRRAAGVSIDDLCRRANLPRLRYLQIQALDLLPPNRKQKAWRDLARLLVILHSEIKTRSVA